MKKKILIIDDEPDILKVMTFRLENLGYEVITAATGIEALDLIQKAAPDMIFLDLHMTGMDGPEIYKRLKSNERSKQIPLILLTADITASNSGRMNRLTADDVLLKPFEPEELLKKVRKFL
ncbi:MAG: response regulator [Candidatus Omnitrophota bacterium]|nr:response regulator [Candidatus Omnitrophota bacterium]